MMRSEKMTIGKLCLKIFLGLEILIGGQVMQAISATNDMQINNVDSEVSNMSSEISGTLISVPISDRLVESHKQFRKRKKDLQSVESTPQPGMISEKTAIELAQNEVWPLDNAHISISVALIEDVYLVDFHLPPFPLYNGPGFVCRRVGIDAWTGNYLGQMIPNEGVQPSSLIYRIGAPEGSDIKEMEAMAKRMEEGDRALRELVRKRGGVPPHAESVPGKIPPSEALKKAEEQVVGRKYDRTREPLVVLVNDMYMVIFWKNEDLVDPDEALYQDIVGVDAKTGDFIAILSSPQDVEEE